jgi:hypothetical protein
MVVTRIRSCRATLGLRQSRLAEASLTCSRGYMSVFLFYPFVTLHIHKAMVATALLALVITVPRILY